MMGEQEAHSGTCYAGFFAFSHGNYREYLQTYLTQPLEKNKTYRFTMFVSLADYAQTYVDLLGVCFLNGKVRYDHGDVIDDQKPVYIKVFKEVGKDVKQWHRVSITYRSHGGESYLLIGSFAVHKLGKTKFKAPKGIKTHINQNSERDSYYYVDDVSLIEIPSVAMADTLKVDLKPVETIAMAKPLVFRNVLFGVNKTELLPSSYSELDMLAQYLDKNPSLHVKISGHTDNTGSEKKNKKLSAGRAQSVSDYLVNKGIERSRVSYVGFGSSKPISSNETEEGKQQNRRVEFVVSLKNQTQTPVEK
jgi:OmpA-OmpF porin, OOP family